MKNTKKQHKISYFIKTYSYAFIIAATVIALATTLALTLGTGNDDTSLQVGTKTIQFGLPVASGTVSKDYSATELQYNEALKQWEIHKAIDFVSDASTQVLSAYEGTIKNVYTDSLNGTVIEIEHEGGLRTVYKSLANNVKLKIGDKVQKGTVIGNMSDSMTKECTGCIHLHFEVLLNGVKVDPNLYLNLSAK